MTTVAIHQPEYMPWLGLIDKARQADVFVLLDDVQFNRSSIQHRCRIAGPDGKTKWLTIPFVHRFPQRIDDVEIADSLWSEHHEQHIRETYAGTPGISGAWPALLALYEMRRAYVASAAVDSMRLLFDVFGAKPRIVRSLEIGATGQKSDRVLDLCRRLGATRYLCGRTAAREYLDHAAFAAAGIEVVVQQFTVPPYRAGLPEGATLSALDAWMYLGDGARDLLRRTHHEERV